MKTKKQKENYCTEYKEDVVAILGLGSVCLYEISCAVMDDAKNFSVDMMLNNVIDLHEKMNNLVYFEGKDKLMYRFLDVLKGIYEYKFTHDTGYEAMMDPDVEKNLLNILAEFANIFSYVAAVAHNRWQGNENAKLSVGFIPKTKWESFPCGR